MSIKDDPNKIAGEDSSNDPLIGQTFGGYEIQRRLGEGGMATVYVAYQTSMRRDVAVKIMRSDLDSQKGTFFTRFEREARTIAALEHVHILPAFDFGEAQGRTYLVMRLLDQSLADYVRQGGPLPLEEVVRLLAQIGDALDYTHEKHVIHRDLKPANVLLDKQKNCFLADFGIAHVVDASMSLTVEGTLVGTPSYISPEQIVANPATAVSDIYSLGVMLYEMICGRVPFTGDSPFVIMNQHLQMPPPSPLKWRPDLPPGCEPVLAKVLAKDPDQRYQSARDLTDAFSAAILQRSDKSIAVESSTTIGGVEAATFVLAPVLETADRKEAVEQQTRPRPVRRRWMLLAFALLVGMVGSLGLALSRAPGTKADADTYNAAGLKALQVLNYKDALDNFKQALQVSPDDAAAYFNLGVTYEEQGDAADAQAAYTSALARDNQLLLAYYRLGELLLDDKEIDKGFQTADEGLRVLQMGNVNIDQSERSHVQFLLYTTRGRAYFLRGGNTDLSLAESDLKEALSVKPHEDSPTETYYYLAQVYHALGNNDQACQAWLNVIGYVDQTSDRQRQWLAEARAQKCQERT